ncbi:unnamed protein product [Cuscuta epithymum]|uniref:Uncharacterized protein n=1 Tax=Cuscuta epithymum TaxID=186058 RepID=A0AAV0GGP8_9ASTE|nr:unnamed protein product [Cuscuta epithymum]CAH9114131.1 unnamed protein product [Cuscuta epithymum]CAH9147036.1 unnamed protein product [Cuscuta epithymum]CAH9147042.1 unnamed protein product [Cuscuta epithymum]
MSELFDTIVRHVPPPTANLDAPFHMLRGVNKRFRFRRHSCQGFQKSFRRPYSTSSTLQVGSNIIIFNYSSGHVGPYTGTFNRFRPARIILFAKDCIDEDVLIRICRSDDNDNVIRVLCIEFVLKSILCALAQPNMTLKEFFALPYIHTNNVDIMRFVFH